MCQRARASKTGYLRVSKVSPAAAGTGSEDPGTRFRSSPSEHVHGIRETRLRLFPGEQNHGQMSAIFQHDLRTLNFSQ